MEKKTRSGFTFVKSVTKDIRKTIKYDSIRKNITKIWLSYDEENEEYYHEVYFNENTVIDTYSDTWIEHTNYSASRDLNEWIEEICWIKEERGEIPDDIREYADYHS